MAASASPATTSAATGPASQVEGGSARTAKAARIERVCFALLLTGIAVYLGLFLRLSFRLYDRFAMHAYDLGIFDQAVWLISRGRTPFVTTHGVHILGDHFSLILYPLAPLYWFAPTPKTLLVVQTLALALAALPVYGFARLRLRSAPLALVCGLAYLLYPPMQWSNAYEFHPDTLATAGLLTAFYFLAAGRWRAYFAALVVVLLTKEVAGLAVAALGAYVCISHRRAGLGTMSMGLAAIVASMLTVAHFNSGSGSAYLSLYSAYGSSPKAIVANLASDPLLTLCALNTDINRQYILHLLRPVCFLPLLAPDILLIALPALLANLLSSRDATHTIYYQYTAFLTPIIVIAFIIGLQRALARGHNMALLLLLATIGLYAVDDLKDSPLLTRQWPLSPSLNARQSAQTARVLRLVPDDASVCAQSALVPHLSHRARIYIFPNPFFRLVWGGDARVIAQSDGKEATPYLPASLAAPDVSAEYVALAPATPYWPLNLANYRSYVKAIVFSRSYAIAAITPDALVLKRGGDIRGGYSLLADQTGRPVTNDAQVAQALDAWLAAF